VEHASTIAAAASVPAAVSDSELRLRHRSPAHEPNFILFLTCVLNVVVVETTQFSSIQFTAPTAHLVKPIPAPRG